MFQRFSLVNLAAVLVVLAYSAVQVPAAAVAQAEGRTSTATITVVTTSFYTGDATSTLFTSKVCAVLDPTATTCRRKRQYWLDVPIIISRDEIIDAYIRQQFQPSPVLG